MPSRSLRAEWGKRKRLALDEADIVFLDPDNGLGGETDKHATLSEIRLLRKPGRAIVFITFPGRNKPHQMLLQHLHERLKEQASAEAVITLQTNVSVAYAAKARSYVQRQRWFTLVDPNADLIARARKFAAALTLRMPPQQELLRR